MRWQDRGPERGAAALAGPMTIGDIASDEELSTGERPSELASPKRNVPNRTGRYALFAAIFLAALALGTYAGLRVSMARMDPPSGETAALLAAVTKPIDAQGAAVAGQPASVPVTPEDVDPRYLTMLLAFEDRRFYSHFGVDPYALTRAGFEFVWHGRIISGGSTLTMQVARILDNKYQRSTSVKVRQIIRAIALESRFTKREILTLYLNLAPFGGKIKGVRAAALTYFGKTPEQLSVGEAALLVALPQAPEARRLDRHLNAARRSRDFVLKTVVAAGVLSPAEAEEGKREVLTVGGKTQHVSQDIPHNLLTLGK
jgi:membrane peptidoglycan carboxypeptidase